MKGANRKHSLDHIFNFIVRFKTEHDGRSPTIREIGDACEISSVSVVQSNLKALARNGRIAFGGRGETRRIVVPGGRWTYEPVQQGGQP